MTQNKAKKLSEIPIRNQPIAAKTAKRGIETRLKNKESEESIQDPSSGSISAKIRAQRSQQNNYLYSNKMSYNENLSDSPKI